MEEPRLDELAYRLQTAEREKQRWKIIAFSALAVLGCLLPLSALVAFRAVFLLQDQRLEAVRAEREAEMRQIRLEEELERSAEKSRLEAEVDQLQRELGQREVQRLKLEADRARLSSELEQEKARRKAGQ